MFRGWRGGSSTENKPSEQAEESSSSSSQQGNSIRSSHRHQQGRGYFASGRTSPTSSHHSSDDDFDDIHDAALDSKPRTPARIPSPHRTAWSSEGYYPRYTPPLRLEQAMQDLRLHQSAEETHADPAVEVDVPPLEQAHLDRIQQMVNEANPRRNRRSGRNSQSRLPPPRYT